LLPTGENVGQIVLRMFIGAERGLRDGGELVISKERRALVVQAPAVRFAVIEPDLIGAARVRFCEEQDGGGNAGVGLEYAAG